MIRTNTGRRRSWLWWGACLTAALAFFSYGIRAGASQPFYVDETYYDTYALQLAQRLLLGAHTKFVTVFPSGYSLVLMVVYGARYLIGRAAGEFMGVTDFLVRFAVHRGDFIVMARWTSAVFATAALPGAYAAARRLFSPTVAWVSTLALAVCYPMVFYAHIAANITMLVCLSAWTIYWIVRVWQDGSVRSYLAAGAFIGAGIATKYYPAAWFLSLLLAHWYRDADARANGQRQIFFADAWKLIVAGIVALVVALAMFPLPILEPGQWHDGLANNLGYYTGGNVLANALSYLVGRAPVLENATAEPVSWWSNSLLVLSHSGLVWIGAGVAFGLISLRRVTWLLVAPFLVFFTYQVVRGGLGLGVRQFYFALPGLWIVAVGALEECCRRFGPKRLQSSHLTVIISALLLAEPGWWAVRFLALSSRPSTVELARVEFARLIPAGAVLLVDSMAAPYGETTAWRSAGVLQADATGVSDEVRAARRQAAPPFDVRPLTWKDAGAELESARETGQPVYVAITDHFSTGYWDPATIRAWGDFNAPVAAARRQYLRDLFDRTETVHVYRPRELHALGPTVTLLQLAPSQ